MAAASWPSHARADELAAPYDCGTLALYNLLALEQQRTDLPRLVASLVPLRPDGYSMRELRHAARNLGLHLDGVKRSRNLAPDRPMLAYVRRGDHGHFLVVRPIGHTGKLVQVIDANLDPFVMDAAELYASSEWTGLALVPARPYWPAWIAGVLAGAAALVLAAGWLVPRLRGRRWNEGRA